MWNIWSTAWETVVGPARTSHLGSRYHSFWCKANILRKKLNYGARAAEDIKKGALHIEYLQNLLQNFKKFDGLQNSDRGSNGMPYDFYCKCIEQIIPIY